MLMACELDFLYGRTIMNSVDLRRWLSIPEFKEQVLRLCDNHMPVNDVDILRIAERVLNENIDSDMINGVSTAKLNDSVRRFRNQIENYKFDHKWLRRNYRETYEIIRRKMNCDDLVAIPTQLVRYAQMLKYVSHIADDGVLKVVSANVDDTNAGTVCVELSRNDLCFDGSMQADEFYGRLRFCDKIQTSFLDSVKISLTINGLFARKADYTPHDDTRKYVLQWNKDMQKECAN